jgi:xylulokinase
MELWLPYLMGERTRIRPMHERPHWVDGQPHVTFTRAVMEGVAFSCVMPRDISRIRSFIEAIRLGGAERSQLWRQIQADVYGQAVETIESDEGPL